VRFEAQRLLLKVVDVLTIIDVGAIVRALVDVDGASDPSACLELAKIHGATPRRLFWFIGPSSVQTPLVTAADLKDVYTLLATALPAPAIIASAEPLAGVLQAVVPERSDITVVTAGVERRPYELQVLSLVSELLDLETGRRWTSADCCEQFGVTPRQLPMLLATTGGPPDRPCPARPRGDLVRYQREIALALSRGLAPAQADVPRTVRESIQRAAPQIDTLAAELRGVALPDTAARQSVALLLPAPVALAESTTAYVAASTTSGVEPLEFVSVSVLAGAARRTAHGHAACTALLRDVHRKLPGRWFAPRALDLLAVLAEHGAPMPDRVVDPGLINYVFNTEVPLELRDYTSASHLLSNDQLAWLSDTRREVDAPVLTGVVEVLPRLDNELRALLAQEELLVLVEEDVSRTLPVLARIERRGAWCGPPHGFASWSALDDAVSAHLGTLERALVPTFGSLSPYGPLEPIVKALLRTHPLAPDDAHLCTKDNDRLDRIAARGSVPAQILVEARSVDRTAAYWRPHLSDGTRISGHWTPQRTGRWGMRGPALTSLPKHGWLGSAIRGAMMPPPGCALVVADYNAFEGRLIAACSGDPLLLEACDAVDFHSYVAMKVFGRADDDARAAAKNVLYAMGYGQTQKGFLQAQHEMTPSDAARTYRRVRKKLAEAVRYQRERRAYYRENPTKPVRTPAGWERFAVTWRQAFNTGIQAYAADIFRWVLRTLDRELAQYNAFLVHQMHDEVFVATPEACVTDVAAAVKRVMEDDVIRTSGLFPSPVRLVADVTVRSSWRKE
jgi:hypothetical protein